MTTFYVSLDVAKRSMHNVKTLTLRAGDKASTTVAVTVLDGGVAYVPPTGAAFTLTGNRPDGAVCSQAMTYSGGVAYATLDGSWTGAAGLARNVYVQVTVGTTVVASTESFAVQVEPCADMTAPAALPYQQRIEAVVAAAESAKVDADKLNAAAQSATTAASSATTAAATANAAAASVESTVSTLSGKVADLSAISERQLFDKYDYTEFRGGVTSRKLSAATNQRTVCIPVSVETATKVTAHRGVTTSRFALFTITEDPAQDVATTAYVVGNDQSTLTIDVAAGTKYVCVYVCNYGTGDSESLYTQVKDSLMVEYGDTYTGYESRIVPALVGGKQDKLTFDAEPTPNSANSLTSSAVRRYVDMLKVTGDDNHVGSIFDVRGLTAVSQVTGFTATGDTSGLTFDQYGMKQTTSAKSYFTRSRAAGENAWRIVVPRETGEKASVRFIVGYQDDSHYEVITATVATTQYAVVGHRVNTGAGEYDVSADKLYFDGPTLDIYDLGSEIFIRSDLSYGSFAKVASYNAKVGFSFAYGASTACRFACMATVVPDETVRLDIGKQVRSSSLFDKNILRIQKAESNPNAIKLMDGFTSQTGRVKYYDAAAAECIAFNLDYSYGEATGVGRYRSELAVLGSLYDAAMRGTCPHGRFEASYLIKAAENVEDASIATIWQLHDSGWTATTLAPPVSVFMQSGRLYLKVCGKSGVPTSSSDYAIGIHDLGPIPYDRWFALEVEYRLGYSDVHRPMTRVRIDGVTVAETYEVNYYDLSVGVYPKFGIYANWNEEGTPHDHTRTMYVKGVVIE